ncbi:MAG: 3-dehydroquinate synthase [Eubacteriales bacterium]|nr:3-dehydroquinate synthase [Eubacteriales bacterium]
MNTVCVCASHGYRVSIEAGLLGQAGQALAGSAAPCRMAVVSDSNVAPLYLESLRGSLTRAGYRVSSFVFPAGEAQKNLSTLSALLEFLAENEFTRSDCIAALGGGVTGDMAGFAAAVYLRGIPYVQIPTTLLAMVDSSVGGKTAVDLPQGKNLAGAFYQPTRVLIDPDTLTTLPDSVLRQGTAEAMKMGILFDSGLFEALAGADVRRRARSIIQKCVFYKAALVARDERDTGERQLLNLGHTFGHAVEQASGLTLPHGDAVAIGMVMAARVSRALGICAEDLPRRVAQALAANGLPIRCPYDAKTLLTSALRDKKRQGEQITLVLPERIGHCRLERRPVAELEQLFIASLREDEP